MKKKLMRQKQYWRSIDYYQQEATKAEETESFCLEIKHSLHQVVTAA